MLGILFLTSLAISFFAREVSNFTFLAASSGNKNVEILQLELSRLSGELVELEQNEKDFAWQLYSLKPSSNLSFHRGQRLDAEFASLFKSRSFQQKIYIPPSEKLIHSVIQRLLYLQSKNELTPLDIDFVTKRLSSRQLVTPGEALPNYYNRLIMDYRNSQKKLNLKTKEYNAKFEELLSAREFKQTANEGIKITEFLAIVSMIISLATLICLIFTTRQGLMKGRIEQKNLRAETENLELENREKKLDIEERDAQLTKQKYEDNFKPPQERLFNDTGKNQTKCTDRAGDLDMLK